jgi:uncharacterized protein YndB with AHSA1/START domain
MADSYRCHAVIEAPLEDVWAVASDARPHPQWWPEVRDWMRDMLDVLPPVVADVRKPPPLP